MRKHPSAESTVNISVSVNKFHKEWIDELIDSGLFQSTSDVVRRAIVELHRKELPAYIHNRSAADALKRKKIQEEKEFVDLPPKDYALSLGALVLPDLSGREFACFHTFGNSVRPIALDELKSLKDDASFQSMLEHHQNMLTELSLEKKLEGAYLRGIFEQKYNIIIPDYITGKDRQKAQVEKGTDQPATDGADDKIDPELPVLSEDSEPQNQRDGDPLAERGIPAEHDGGDAGHNGLDVAERPDNSDRSEDREGPSTPRASKLLESANVIRSHSPNS